MEKLEGVFTKAGAAHNCSSSRANAQNFDPILPMIDVKELVLCLMARQDSTDDVLHIYGDGNACFSPSISPLCRSSEIMKIASEENR